MPQEGVDWEYTVQLMDGAVLYRGPKTEVKTGIVWELQRSMKLPTGKSYTETVVSSAEVFQDGEVAKLDALEKLSILRCPIDRPVDVAIKWMLDGV